ncbi:MAG: hypothetical protein Q7K26_06660 [bacterium]|nr:hypothetical protein [bacterium]
MKVHEILEALKNADPNMDVCLFADDSVFSVEDVNVWSGEYRRPFGAKVIFESINGTYVGLGNPGNYDSLCQDSVCHHVKDLMV